MHKRSERWNDGEHPIRTEKEKTNLKNGNSLRALWDNIKHINIWNIEVPEGKEGEKGSKQVYQAPLKNLLSK